MKASIFARLFGMAWASPLTSWVAWVGASSFASDINDLGQVVGSFTTSEGETHAFLWDSANGIQDLGTLGGSYSSAHSINELGQVVGTAAIMGDGQQHAFIWDSVNGIQDLGPLYDPSDFFMSVATAINENGIVVGHALMTGAFVWNETDGMWDLGAELDEPGSAATDVNDHGTVVGYASSASGPTRAYIWSSDTGVRYLGRFPGEDSTHISHAYAVNNSNQVVGYRGRHAFFWQFETGMLRLENMPGHTYSYAYGINDDGWVVGGAGARPHELHATAWSPVVIPEPATILALLCGVCGLAWRRRK